MYPKTVSKIKFFDIFFFLCCFQEQQTPLHIASRLGNVDIVVLLLQSGAAVDATTKDLYTALHIAAKEGQEEVKHLIHDIFKQSSGSPGI